MAKAKPAPKKPLKKTEPSRKPAKVVAKASKPAAKPAKVKAEKVVGKLAKAVGMERTHLYRKLKDLDIDPRGPKGAADEA